jgi:hypothetical protein
MTVQMLWQMWQKFEEAEVMVCVGSTSRPL